MAIREKSEKILKESIKRMREEKAILSRDLNDAVKDLNNLQTRKANLQTAIDEVNAAIDAVKKDLEDGGIVI